VHALSLIFLIRRRTVISTDFTDANVATSSTSLATGTIVAGTQRGSHVVVGSPDLLKRIPIGGASIFGGVMTLGAGSIVDVATGAGLSLSPNPVTVFLAPEVTEP